MLTRVFVRTFAFAPQMAAATARTAKSLWSNTSDVLGEGKSMYEEIRARTVQIILSDVLQKRNKKL